MISGNWGAGAKTLTITLDGVAVTEDVVTVTLTDDINGATDPKIGSTCAAVLAMTVQKPRHAYSGKKLAVSVAGIPLGEFTVSGVDAKDERSVITAVDAMATSFESDYVPSASSSTALTVIRDVCRICGVTVGDVSGVTDVPVSGLTSGHTCREILSLMAALLGRNAHIDRYGRLVLRWYAASGVTVTSDAYYPGDLTKQDADYSIARLECTAHIQEVTVEDGVTTEETVTTVYTSGTGATGISITDDFMTQTILDSVYTAIGGLTYRPMAVTFYGDARIETGDLLTVSDVHGSAYAVPVMKVTHIWDGGVRTTVEAFGNPAEGLSLSPSGALSRSVSNLIAEFARFKNLEAENIRAMRAKIEEIIAGDIALYGRMAVYMDDTLSNPGGWFGYTVGDEAGILGHGMYMSSIYDQLSGTSLMVLSHTGFFLGHKTPGPSQDGGADSVDIGGFDTLIQTLGDGIEIQAERIAIYAPYSDTTGVGMNAEFGYEYDPTTAAYARICKFFGKVFINGTNIETALASKQNTLTFDTTPTQNSNNPVTSGGVKAALPVPSTSTPLVDGTAAVGSETAFARGDHRHPTDTTRAPTSHRSTGTTYGVGNGSYYGHLRLSAATNSTNGTSNGYAATPSAVKAAYDAAVSAQSTADDAYDLANTETSTTTFSSGTITTIKFGDGTMIVTGRGILISGCTFSSWGGIADCAVPQSKLPSFPTPFIEAPTITATASGGYSVMVTMVYRTAERITGMNIARGSTISNVSTYIDFTAIGRWKE